LNHSLIGFGFFALVYDSKFKVVFLFNWNCAIFNGNVLH